jgi:hypothetical protein
VICIKSLPKPGVVSHASNPSTQESDGGRLGVQDQPGLYRELLSQKTKMKQNKILPRQLLCIHPGQRDKSQDSHGNLEESAPPQGLSSTNPLT